MFEIKNHLKTKLRRSTFGHYFERNEHACAYNSLTMDRIYFDSSLLTFVNNLDGVIVNEILQKAPANKVEEISNLITNICNLGIIVPQEYDELSHLNLVNNSIFNGPRIRVMVMHLTESCNLKCKYCFVEGQYTGSNDRGRMSINTAKESVRFFGRIISNNVFSKPPSIVLYGGEPLLNWPAAKATLEEIKKLKSDGKLDNRTNVIIITNGTLITDNIASVLKQHDVHVAVSIDGPEEVHDKYRKTRKGKGSFGAAMRGIEKLKQHGVRPTISSVMTKDTIPRLEAVLDFFSDKLEVKGIGFNHVSIVPNQFPYDSEYEKEFANTIVRAQEYNAIKHPGVYERRMSPRIRNFRTKMLVKSDCTGCGEQFSVSPDAKVGICQGFIGERKTFGGSVYDKSFDPHMVPEFQEWSTRSPLTMEECKSCPALATCGGGCPRNAYTLTGSIWNLDKGFCHFAQKAHEWLIWNVGFGR
ncbi:MULTISPECIES: radical SAM/SPASM domain-containing protein [unclassified Agarivorans]|uniref:radical SAM/SPASM domain-containing protein n=1 Tax=unclassified Agarivorans TaxID=2636026 RepID=UPI0026E214BF|nr:MULTISPECIES: radical SAM protein [unclassified Agarivorans]MDO6684603.1 radical SAM protein [Agarivorans sp. 3_MG-2023]MDO6714768.1 radical SAM protein [Agarivorans sp. 2_MG-2023]